MAKYTPENIRNVAFVGHGGTGKTTLVEEMLFKCKANNRIGLVKDGSSVSDYSQEEIDSTASIDLSLIYATHKGNLFQLFDAPGRSDFVGQAQLALYSADIALINVDAYSGMQVNTKKAWAMATKMNKAKAVILNKVDVENVDLPKVIAEVQETLGNQCVPFFLPDTTGGGISKLYSVLNPADDAPEIVTSFHEPLIEAIVETDEELMMRYLDGEDISGELTKYLGAAIRSGDLVPILVHGQKDTIGIEEILDTLVEYFPSPAEQSTVQAMIMETDEEGEPHLVPTSKELNDEQMVAQVVRVVIDEHKGKMAIIKLLSGQVQSGGTFHNVVTGKNGRFGKLVKMFGARHDEVENAGRGEVVAAVKVDELNLGDTISDGKWKDPVQRFAFPVPMVALAVRPRTRSDEAKLSQVLQRFVTEDPCFRNEIDRQTKEMIIYGMSELHLNVILGRMEKYFGVSVDTRLPKISYRETITKGVQDFYRHKKQSGGSGEFAEVHFKMRPYKEGDFSFVDALRGDNVRRQFVPSVEKGCKAIMDAGILTGSPVMNIEVEFYDGKDHPVDGKDSAFQKAAKDCFKKCFLQASPVLLEPIVELEISFPSNYSGDVNQFINGHRGRINGMDHAGAEQVLSCSIPLAETQTFSTDLRSMTQGQGSFAMDMAGYEIVPPNVQSKIIEDYKKLSEDDS